MKIKDLLDFNPEAEIKVGFVNTDMFYNTGMLYNGKISYGWDAGGDCEPGIDTKATAKEVCIFLGDTSELTQYEV